MFFEKQITNRHMYRLIKFVLLLNLFSCSSGDRLEIPGWKLYSTESLKHSETDREKIQVIISLLHTGILSFSDTTLVVQQFIDSLLTEEIEFKLDNNDSTKWSHHVRNYNSLGLLTEKIDSLDGHLSQHSKFYYEDRRETRAEHLDLLPNYSEAGDLIYFDTLSSIVHSYYDKNGKCDRVMALSKDQLKSQFEGATSYDTTITYHQFDKNGNNVKSISISRGDTTSISTVEYDELNRQVKLLSPLSRVEFKYDASGNVVSELLYFGKFAELLVTEFDAQNRPTKRKRYRQN